MCYVTNERVQVQLMPHLNIEIRMPYNDTDLAHACQQSLMLYISDGSKRQNPTTFVGKFG